jgi:hypothetical protein
MSQGQFKTDQAWQALVALLEKQLQGVDVAAISSQDFNEDGEIIMDPPSVRVFFAGEAAAATSDSQRLSYLVDGRYVVLCADQDRTSVFDQANASIQLVTKVKNMVAGSRLLLTDGDISEPLIWVSTEVQPVDGIGVAYGVGFIIPGLAQFTGANAHPQGGN